MFACPAADEFFRACIGQMMGLRHPLAVPGKARRPYEFRVKAGIACIVKGNPIVGIRAFRRNPCDSHRF